MSTSSTAGGPLRTKILRRGFSRPTNAQPRRRTRPDAGSDFIQSSRYPSVFFNHFGRSPGMGGSSASLFFVLGVHSLKPGNIDLRETHFSDAATASWPRRRLPHRDAPDGFLPQRRLGRSGGLYDRHCRVRDRADSEDQESQDRRSAGRRRRRRPECLGLERRDTNRLTRTD